MKTLTLAQYNAIHRDFRGVWTTERTDWPNWAADREKYMGKRTMNGSDGNGRTCLEIEGMSFEIKG